MTIERETDPDATLKLPRLPIDGVEEEFDPEKTIVREDWETRVMRRIAPRVAAVRRAVEVDAERFGWESEGLRRLSRKLHWGDEQA